MTQRLLPAFFILWTSLTLLSACTPADVPQADAGPAITEDASVVDANVQDAAPTLTAQELLAGVWGQRVQAYPEMRVIWSLHPDGWGNIDVLGHSGGSWCRNYVDWQIVSEDSNSSFVYSYTFTQPSCGQSEQGDTLNVHVDAQVSTDPLTLHTDWGGDATMQLCGRDFGSADPCGEGDDLGAAAEQP